MKKLLVILATLLNAALSPSWAITRTYSSDPVVTPPTIGPLDIPIVVDGEIGSITDVDIHIVIRGGYIPDLLAVSGYGVLSDPFVYLFDSGTLPNVTPSGDLDIWFSDGGLALSSYAGAPGGAYQPTGFVSVDPLDPDYGGFGLLSVFNGLLAQETWYLSLDDILPNSGELGNEDASFIQWELRITGDAASNVPDALPGMVPAVSLLGMVAADAMRRRMKR